MDAYAEVHRQAAHQALQALGGFAIGTDQFEAAVDGRHGADRDEAATAAAWQVLQQFAHLHTR